MAITYKVEIEGNEGFILNTDVLDSGVLGYLATDVTQYVRSAVSKRGRSSNLGRFTAGQLTVVFDNRGRVFDPNYVSSPLYGAIKPRRKIRFYAGYDVKSLVQQFEGYIDNWDFDYDISGDSIATASASDAFTIFAQQLIDLVSPASELSSDRVRRVLTNSAVAWPLDLFISTGGAFTMNSVTYSGNVLDYLQTIADSEDGFFYVNQSGVVTFLGWNAFTTVSIGSLALWFSDQYQESIPYFPDFQELPFSSLQTTYGTDQFYNIVTATSSAGTVTSQNILSQDEFGISSVDLPVLTAGTAQMGVLTDHMVDKYGEPLFRVTNVSVTLDGMVQAYGSEEIGSAAITKILFYDFGARAQVQYTPNQVGSQLTTTGNLIGKTVTATPDRCDVSLDFGLLESRTEYI